MSKKKNKKSKKTLIIFVIVLIVIISTITVIKLSKKKNDNESVKLDELVGEFYYDKNSTYEFDGKGNGCLYSEGRKYKYTYTIDSNNLKIHFLDENLMDATYSFKLDKNKLLLTSESGAVTGDYVLEKRK